MIDVERNSTGVRLLRGTLFVVMRVLFRIEYSGKERVPKTGPLIIVANHVTYLDPLWIALPLFRKIRFMTWDKVFSFPPAGAFLRWLGAFPVSLENPEMGAFKTALRILRRGEALMMFPEGGRSPDGRLMQFKHGASRLALRTGATILPVVIQGGARVWNSRMWVPRPGKVRVEYLEPIHAVQCDEGEKELTDRFRHLIECCIGATEPVS